MTSKINRCSFKDFINLLTFSDLDFEIMAQLHLQSADYCSNFTTITHNLLTKDSKIVNRSRTMYGEQELLGVVLSLQNKPNVLLPCKMKFVFVNL